MKRILAVLTMSVIAGAVGLAAGPSQMLSKRELKILLATANSPEDHNRLAEHYRLKAERLEAEANQHIEMAKLYRSRGGAAGTKWPASTFTTKHCEDLAKDLRTSPAKARVVSSEHVEMAQK